MLSLYICMSTCDSGSDGRMRKQVLFRQRQCSYVLCLRVAWHHSGGPRLSQQLSIEPVMSFSCRTHCIIYEDHCNPGARGQEIGHMYLQTMPIESLGGMPDILTGPVKHGPLNGPPNQKGTAQNNHDRVRLPPARCFLVLLIIVAFDVVFRRQCNAANGQPVCQV